MSRAHGLGSKVKGLGFQGGFGIKGLQDLGS